MTGALAECDRRQRRAGAACGMPEEIALSTDTAMLFCTMHTVDGACLTHVARLMQHRSDVVKGLRGTDTNDNLGACPTTLCGMRITRVYRDDMCPSRGDLDSVDCVACRRIAGCIMDGMTSLARREMFGTPAAPGQRGLFAK